MSTRSFICAEQSDGSYKGIYCHWDGYLTHNGALLLDYYKDAKKVEDLLAVGDISSLAPNIAPDPVLGEHSFDGEHQEGVVIAYGRDRGEKDTAAKTITLEQAKESWCEYMYIFGRDGKWRYYDLSEDEPELHEVEPDLNLIFDKEGITRPIGEYGWFSDSDFKELRQQQIQKGNSVM